MLLLVSVLSFLGIFSGMATLGFHLSVAWLLLLSLGGIGLAALVYRLLSWLILPETVHDVPKFTDGLCWVLLLFWVPLWTGGVVGHLFAFDWAGVVGMAQDTFAAFLTR